MDRPPPLGPLSIREWRALHDITQAEAAAMFGISPRQWQYYEAGVKDEPKWMSAALFGTLVFDLCKMYGYNVFELIRDAHDR